MISRIVNAEIDGRRLSDAETPGAYMRSVIAGLDRVPSPIGFVMTYPARQPERRRALAAAPGRIPHARKELIRRGTVLDCNDLAIILKAWPALVPEFEIDEDEAVAVKGGTVATVTSLPLRWEAT